MAPAAGGGTNWPGGSYDPETHILYVSSNSSVGALGLVPPAPGQSDLAYIQGSATAGPRRTGGSGSQAGGGQRVVSAAPGAARAEGGDEGGGGGGGGVSVQGLPLLKPPYGVISAIDLDQGELLWKIAHGETPDNIRNHPALKGLTIPRTGRPGSVGTLVTKALLIAGEPGVGITATGARGSMLRAYNKATGAEVGAVYMPAPQSGSPMTYLAGGKQYLVLAISGGSYSGELLAFRLPG
jgi:quinoprotein glucose dehydrogenase